MVEIEVEVGTRASRIGPELWKDEGECAHEWGRRVCDDGGAIVDGTDISLRAKCCMRVSTQL